MGWLDQNLNIGVTIVSPGLNFRLSDINCALGLNQLKK